MAVKLLCSDAQKLFAQKISDFTRLQDKIEDCYQSLLRQSQSAAETFYEEVRSQRQTIQQGLDQYRGFLGNHDIWSRCQEEPFDINFANGTDKELFGKRLKGKSLFYQNAFYEVVGPYEVEESKVLLIDHVKKLRDRVEHVMASQDSEEAETQNERRPIPEKIRHEVWRRDQGKCVGCGSAQNLEFDHIVPVSRGGSNTARNIQILCEPCNRRKSDRI